jgi:hypothetical protein
MQMKSIVTGAIVALALTGCQKEMDNIRNEADKAGTNAQLAGRWQNCSETGTAWGLVGIKSQKTIMMFAGGTAKTVELYSEVGCPDAALVGDATYTGDVSVGNPTGPEEANILDLNYRAVSLKISKQETLDTINNNPIVPGCGITDWKLNEARDVTAVAGDVNCPITKPAQVFDVVKTNGTELFFGLSEAGHDKATPEARPVQIDRSPENKFVKM